MNTFVVGIIVGFVLFSIVASMIVFFKTQLEVGRIGREIDNLNKVMQMAFLKINKIEKVTENTMNAAENFIDALRESAEQMQQGMMRPPPMGRINKETFDDLRKSFEDGIKHMEQGMGESDEDIDEPEEPDEPWKK